MKRCEQWFLMIVIQISF